MHITIFDMIARVAVAIGLSSVVGIERTLAGKTAGMRTYAMVSLGAALFTLISEIIIAGGVNASATSPVTIPAAIITGIGFIGAGLILFQNNKTTGITTAAGLWVCAGLGMASGLGFFNLAIVSTVAALFIFTVLWFFESLVKRFAYDGDE